MAKIIQFPVKSSNAYTNLEQLIAISDSTASIEEYFEVMAVCDEAGYFLPGEIEKLTEQVRQKRLDLAKPELKPAVNADAPGLYLYCPEMGEQKPQCQIEAARSYYGRHYHISTPLELKGRGITFDRVLEAKNLTERYQYKDGWNEYTVTERAFDMLQQKYSISQESLLD